MSKFDRCQAYDIMMARRDIARNGGKYPLIYARRRLTDLSAKPWKNRNDWVGRVDAYQRIVRELTSHVEIRRDS